MIQICIVDDDASVRKSLANLLKSAGYATQAFASGEAFLASSAAEVAGCVLLDLRMDGMNGLEVQRLLRAAGKGVAVICMSAHFDDDDIAAALSDGAVCFLHKPFSEQVLLKAIEAAVKAR